MMTIRVTVDPKTQNLTTECLFPNIKENDTKVGSIRCIACKFQKSTLLDILQREEIICGANEDD